MSASEYLTYYRQQRKGLQQIGFNDPDFRNILRTIRYQRGYSQAGYGFWSNLLASIKPFLRNVAAPVLKNVGKEVGKGLLRSGVDMGEKLLQGENIKTAFKDTLKSRGNETLGHIGSVLKQQLGGRRKRTAVQLIRHRKRLRLDEIDAPKKRRVKQPSVLYRQFLKGLHSLDAQKHRLVTRTNPEKPKRRKRQPRKTSRQPRKTTQRKKPQKKKFPKVKRKPTRKNIKKSKQHFIGLYDGE